MDFVQLPEEMPAQLIDYVGRTFGPGDAATTPVLTQADALGKIFHSCDRRRAMTDFSLDKHNTIVPRVEDYVRYLQLTRGEVVALFRDLLIGVTNFSGTPRYSKRSTSRSCPSYLRASPPVV